MRTYEKQFVRHLVYHWIEGSWYRELSQICILRVRTSLCFWLCASENQALPQKSENVRPHSSNAIENATPL